MQARLVTARLTFEGMLDAWRSLGDLEGRDCLMASPEWAQAWWDAFGEGRAAAAVLLEGDGRTEGVFPLQLYRGWHRGFRLRTIALIENGSTPRAILPVVRADEALRAGLERLLEADGQWDLLALRRVPRSSSLAAHLESLLAESKRPHVRREALRSPYLETEGGWDEWLATRSPKFRKTLRNQTNRAQRLEGIAFEEVLGQDRLLAALPEYETLCSRTWKQRAGSGLDAAPKKKEFLRRLIHAFGEGGALVLWTLRSRQRLIAAELHLRDGCGTHALRGDFDESFASHSPGSALEAEIIRASFDRGYREHDFCGDAHAYKLRWTDTVRESDDFLVFSRRIVPAVAGLLERRLVPKLRRLAGSWRSRKGDLP